MRCVDIEPGQIAEQNLASIDNEREANQKRKSTVEYKQKRRQNYLKRKARNKTETNRGILSYESALDPDLLQRALVTPEQMKEFENTVPEFT